MADDAAPLLAALPPQSACANAPAGAEFIHWSATKLAKAIREKTLSSEEVVRAYICRIEAVNRKINAVVQLAAERESFPVVRQSSRRADPYSAKRGVLASDRGEIGRVEIIKPTDVELGIVLSHEFGALSPGPYWTFQTRFSSLELLPASRLRIRIIATTGKSDQEITDRRGRL